MSRLYIKTRSDIGKGTGKGASEKCKVEIYWGSAGDSKLLGSLEAYWRKGESEPNNLHIITGESQNPIDPEILTYSDFHKNGEEDL